MVIRTQAIAMDIPIRATTMVIQPIDIPDTVVPAASSGITAMAWSIILAAAEA
jgi:hypothetical protein